MERDTSNSLVQSKKKDVGTLILAMVKNSSKFTIQHQKLMLFLFQTRIIPIVIKFIEFVFSFVEDI